MEREPLAEQSAGCEPLANGIEMFAGVKETGAVLAGMEEVCHDDVVAPVGRANVATGIGDEDSRNKNGGCANFSRGAGSEGAGE